MSATRATTDFFAGAGGALLGAADHAFESGDGKTLAHAGAPVDALVLSSLKRDFFDNVTKISGNFDFTSEVARDPSFLRGDGHAFLNAGRVMGTNFRADAIFERRDDFAACGVVFGICGEHEQDIERQAQRVALNLNVALLHDVEQTYLDFSGEIRKFIDREDAAIRAGKQSVVNGQLVRKIAPTASGTNRIDIADNVGHGYVRSRKLFDVAAFTGHPRDWSVIALSRDFVAAETADGSQWIVINFTTHHYRNFRVEQIDQPAQNAAFGLAAKAQQNEIVAREQRIDDLRDDRVFVAVDAGEQWLVLFDHAQEVLAHFIFH